MHHREVFMSTTIETVQRNEKSYTCVIQNMVTLVDHIVRELSARKETLLLSLHVFQCNKRLIEN